jgi:hypothetical protein
MAGIDFIMGYGIGNKTLSRLSGTALEKGRPMEGAPFLLTP